jgi:hypothetical protein
MHSETVKNKLIIPVFNATSCLCLLYGHCWNTRAEVLKQVASRRKLPPFVNNFELLYFISAIDSQGGGFTFGDSILYTSIFLCVQ